MTEGGAAVTPGEGRGRERRREEERGGECRKEKETIINQREGAKIKSK